MKILAKVRDKILSFHESHNMEKRTICRKNGKPYLTRYYLFRKKRKWQPSIYLHCFHESDEDMELHNHPWNYSLSLILDGSYKEEYRDRDNGVKTRVVAAGSFNFVQANKFHRVELETKNVWTIFVSGKKGQKWGFWNRDTHEYVDESIHEERKARREASR